MDAREYDREAYDFRRAVPLFGRALRLRCPNCGGRNIFANWFTLREQCPTCGLKFDRAEDDYFIGAYLFNLVAVELLVAALIGVVIFATMPNPPWTLLQYGAVVLVLFGAFVCYPFAKTTWLAFDILLRPVTPGEMEWYEAGGSAAGRDLPQL